MPACNLLLILNSIYAISFHWSNMMIQMQLLYSEYHNARISGMAPCELAWAQRGSTEGPWLLATNAFFTLRRRRAHGHLPPHTTIALLNILDLCSS